MAFDENEPEPTITSDGENATKFHPEEAPVEQRDHYKLLAGYNSGIYNREWADQKKIRRIDNLHIYDAIAGQLELTDWQKNYGRDLLKELNVRRIGYSIEYVAFTVCALTVRRDRRIYYPTRCDEDNDSLFCDLAENLGLRPTKVQSCMARLAPLFPWGFNQ